MYADAAAAELPVVDAGGLAILLDQPPRRLAVDVPPREPKAAGCQWAEGAFGRP
jgi:hypothetical protein